MKEIVLTQGKTALVDDEDYEYLNQFKWHAYKDKRTFYARRYVSCVNNKTILCSMHREILGLLNTKFKADHIDHNGLNNQRINLRPATSSQNCSNRQSGGASKYLGVFLNTSTYKGRTYRYWQSCVQKEGKKLHIGCFKTEAEAAIAYNNAAKLIHGEFANFNTIL